MQDCAAPKIVATYMQRIPLWRWTLHNKKTGRTYTSHKFMTEAEALAKDPRAVRIEWLTAWKWTAVPSQENKAKGMTDEESH